MKIFSYIINFVRFRESQTATIDEHFNKTEKTKSRIETLFLENQDMEARLDEMKRERRSMDMHMKEKTKRNEELKARLLEMKKGQERIAERLERVKAEKSQLTSALEERTERCLEIRQESEKLRPYVLQSPAALQSNLTELSDNLSRDRSQIDALEKRTRALQTSTDTFHMVTNDVTSCVKVLDEVANELHKEDEELLKAAKRRDALSERGNNVREVERKEALLQRQLKRWLERTETVRSASREKAQAAKEKMEELRGVHRQLTEERTEKGREMERRRLRIEQTEKKVWRNPKTTPPIAYPFPTFPPPPFFFFLFSPFKSIFQTPSFFSIFREVPKQRSAAQQSFFPPPLFFSIQLHTYIYAENETKTKRNPLLTSPSFLSFPPDDRSKRKHLERNPRRARRILETRLAYQALHY